MKRILFVDDEANVLQGLQRMLHPMRGEWEMEFVESGRMALERMTERPFDVIVSDLQMPVMNGAELLNEVMARFPQTVRIILTGSADEALAFKCVEATHQCLPKPCDPDELRVTIVRATSIAASLENEGLKKLVSQIDRLPTVPALYTEITRALQNPETTVDEVGEIIARDIGMTAKILKLVNSAFFGLGRTILTPTEAAMYLGLGTIQSLVLLANVFSEFESAQAGGYSLEDLMNHSLQTSAAARIIAREEGVEQRLLDEAAVAGMLHDTGKLILAANFPHQYMAALRDAARERTKIASAEKKFFRADHAEVGGYLLGLWGLPAPIVEAVALHHSPSRTERKTFSSLIAVHVANTLVQDQTPAASGIPASQIDEGHLTELGLRDRLEVWRAVWQTHQDGLQD